MTQIFILACGLAVVFTPWVVYCVRLVLEQRREERRKRCMKNHPSGVQQPIDPMDPCGDGTIKPGDEMHEIMKLAMNDEAVIADRAADGTLTVQNLPEATRDA